MSAVIEKALATATTVVEEAEVLALEAEIKRLTTLHEELLPAERTAKAKIAEKGRELRQRLTEITTTQALDLPRLDPTILAWTKIQPAWYKIVSKQLLNLPVFAYVPLNQPSCDLRVTREDQWGNVPQIVMDQYGEMFKGLRKHLSQDPFTGRRRINLSYTYEGVIPDEMRKIIAREHLSGRFDDLGLICEVDKWEINEERVPRQLLDPILVGVKNNALWVLGSFDPTPVEHYITQEFTS